MPGRMAAGSVALTGDTRGCGACVGMREGRGACAGGLAPRF